VVGVGCGPGMLTAEAIDALASGKLAYGSRRAIELAAEHLEKDCEVHELTEYSNLDDLPDDALLLSTGDPMLAGLGRKAVKVIPGISSFQLGCARLGISWERTEVISVHSGGGDPAADAADALTRGRTVFLLVAPAFDVVALASRLQGKGLSARVAVLERLGYPDERIAVGPLSRPPEARSKLFSLFIGEW